MANEYIERAALLAAYDRQHEGEPGRARKLIEEAPSADVAPVIHAKWVDTDPETPDWSCTKNGMAYYCSACGHPAGKHKHKTYKYCPWCGAYMGGANDS